MTESEKFKYHKSIEYLENIADYFKGFEGVYVIKAISNECGEHCEKVIELIKKLSKENEEIDKRDKEIDKKDKVIDYLADKLEEKSKSMTKEKWKIVANNIADKKVGG